MLSQSLLAALVVIGCGGDGPSGPATDASTTPDQGLIDSSRTDAGGDAAPNPDGSMLDGGAVEHPADWSFLISHGVRACSGFVETDAPSMLGSTAIPKGVTHFTFNAKLIFGVIKSFTDGSHLADCTQYTDNALGEKPDLLQQWEPVVTAFPAFATAPRGRYARDTLTYDSVLSAWSACPAMTAQCTSTIQPGSIGVMTYYSGTYFDNRIRPLTSGMAAADTVAIIGGGLPSIVVAGRLEQGTFDFDLYQFGVFQGTAPAIFVASYVAPGTTNGNLLAQWLKVFPTTTVPKVQLGNQKDEPFFGGHLEQSGSTFLLTVPFADSLDLGSAGKLTAPVGSYALAFVTLDQKTGKVLASESFGKGPASKNKVSRGRVIDLGNGTFAYVDTVWDTIDLGSGLVVNSSQGADVLVAILDAKGKVTKHWMYGGSGDDEAFGVLNGAAGTATIIGRSTASIDLGNGSLAGPGIWYAGVTP